MQPIKIYFASDHGGFHAKNHAYFYCVDLGYECVDLGTNSEQSVDYPDFANLLASKLASDTAAFGVLVCGSGIGISMAANRFKHIRCALCHDENTAKLAREHNDANVLAFGGRFCDEKMIKAMLDVFLNTEFEGGRHEKRVAKLGL